MSDGNEQITLTPAISVIFSSMLSTVNGHPFLVILSKMLSGDFNLLFMVSIGLRSYCMDSS